jgi:hypothetical protein
MKLGTAIGLVLLYIAFGPIAFLLMLCDNKQLFKRNK